MDIILYIKCETNKIIHLIRKNIISQSNPKQRKKISLIKSMNIFQTDDDQDNNSQRKLFSIIKRVRRFTLSLIIDDLISISYFQARKNKLENIVS